MKKMIILLSCFVTIACGKKNNTTPPPSSHPEMFYTDLKNTEMRPGVPRIVDLTDDNHVDFLFQTILIGDPLLMRDRLQFLAFSTIGTYVLADPNNNTVVLNKDEKISTAAPQGYGWFEVQDILLAEKITPLTGPVSWEGTWKDAVHKYLPVQTRNGELRFNGWIELTMDKTAEKIILHRAGISTEAGRDIKAGH